MVYLASFPYINSLDYFVENKHWYINFRSRIEEGRLKMFNCKIYYAECEYYCDKNSKTLMNYLDMPETCLIFLLN